MDMFADEKTPRQNAKKVIPCAPTSTATPVSPLPCLQPKLFSVNDVSTCNSPRVSEYSQNLAAARASHKEFVVHLRERRVLKPTLGGTIDDCSTHDVVPLRHRECAALRLPTAMPRLVEVAPMENGETREASFKAYYELIKRTRV